MRTPTVISCLIAFTLSATPAAAQCTKDTDCKGNRICERGRCTDVDAPLPLEPESAAYQPRLAAGAAPVPVPAPVTSAPVVVASAKKKAAADWFRSYGSISSQIGASGWGGVVLNESGDVDHAKADLGIAMGTRLAGLGVVSRRCHIGGFFSYVSEDSIGTISLGLSMKFGGQIGSQVFLSGVIDLGYQRWDVFNGFVLFPRFQVDILTARAGGFKWALFGALGTEMSYGRVREDGYSVHYYTVRPMFLFGTTFGG